jgi:7,8-dihydropterin-6-yl-methyl-4-(beta-D-ribofuranosyl)aminobenzene 5'-phosphate synthase
MIDPIKRRDFLKTSAAFAVAAAGGFRCVELASAAPIQVPPIDKLTAHVLVDSSFDLFARPTQAGGVSMVPAPRSDVRRNLHGEWGLSLYLQSERAGEQRNLMLDFGYSSPVLLNNIEVIGVDPGKLDALIVSHGHFDHYGGLQGFLKK